MIFTSTLAHMRLASSRLVLSLCHPFLHVEGISICIADARPVNDLLAPLLDFYGQSLQSPIQHFGSLQIVQSFVIC